MLLYNMRSHFSSNKKLIKRYYDLVKAASFKNFFMNFGQTQKKELASLKAMSKINSIQFVFNNGAVLKLLKERGHALMKAKFE